MSYLSDSSGQSTAELMLLELERLTASINSQQQMQLQSTCPPTSTKLLTNSVGLLCISAEAGDEDEEREDDDEVEISDDIRDTHALEHPNQQRHPLCFEHAADICRQGRTLPASTSVVVNTLLPSSVEISNTANHQTTATLANTTTSVSEAAEDGLRTDLDPELDADLERELARYICSHPDDIEENITFTEDCQVKKSSELSIHLILYFFPFFHHYHYSMLHVFQQSSSCFYLSPI
ncbi:unnamed protein product [Protopolystoma xenopodis]|uniref:Uncharacterized protein n=1 Tax=Protopolystoma xenopodis TaxID=117903 RepID=A0A448WV90_9PLAT|nr:unnamed protein product [Protopolystoma xenopodis]